MPMEAGAIGIRPVSQPQRTGGSEGVQRREDGGSGSGFRPQTNVAIKTAIDDMAGVLSKISTNEKLSMEKLPEEVSQVVKNVLQQAFKMDSTLSQGIGSTLESQRFSMEQLSVFARMLTQIGALAEKGFSMELSDQMELLLKNFKSLVVSEEGGDTLEPVLLSKAAFELIDSKTAEQLPQQLYAILSALSSGTSSQTSSPQMQESEAMSFLNQLVKLFMPRPSADSSGEAEQSNPSQAQNQRQAAQSQARQFLQSMFGNLKAQQGQQSGQDQQANQAQGQPNQQPQMQGQQAQQFNQAGQPQQMQQNQPGQPQQFNQAQQNQPGQQMNQAGQPQQFNQAGQPQQMQQNQPGQPQVNAELGMRNAELQGQPNQQTTQSGQPQQMQQNQPGQPQQMNQQNNFNSTPNSPEQAQRNFAENQAQPQGNSEFGMRNAQLQGQPNQQMNQQANQPGQQMNQPQAQGQQNQQPQMQQNNQPQQMNQPQQFNNQQQPQMQNQSGQPQQAQQFNQAGQPQQNQPGQPQQMNQSQPQQFNQEQQENFSSTPNPPTQSQKNFLGNQPQTQAQGQPNQPPQMQQMNQPQQNQPGQPQQMNQPQMQQNNQAQQMNQSQTNQSQPQMQQTNQNQQPQMQNQPQQAQQFNQAGQPQQMNQPQAQGQPQMQGQQTQQSQNTFDNSNLQAQQQLFSQKLQAQLDRLEQGDDFLAKQQQLKTDLQAAKTVLLKQPMQNTPETMQTMKDLAQLLLKNPSITERDTATLKNFVNNTQEQLSEGEARHLQNLLRLCQQNVPITVQQAAVQQKLPDLPRLWAFMQLCDMAALTSKLSAKAFKRAGRDVAEFANAMRQSMGGDNASVQNATQNNRSLQMMMPLYVGDNENSYPTYLHVYDENEKDKETGEDKKETWLRICVLTDYIGAVELTFRMYENNQLDMRFYFSERSVANEFRTYIPSLKEKLKETSLEVGEVRIGSVGERMTSEG